MFTQYSEMNCSKCEFTETAGDLLAACDNCGCRLCQSCAKLSATEYRAVTMKKRAIVYWCFECTPAALPNLGSHTIHSLKVDIERSVSDIVRSEVSKLVDGFMDLRDNSTELMRLCQPKSLPEGALLADLAEPMRQIGLLHTDVLNLTDTVNNLRDSNIELVKLCQPKPSTIGAQLAVSGCQNETELRSRIQHLEAEVSELRRMVGSLTNSSFKTVTMSGGNHVQKQRSRTPIKRVKTVSPEDGAGGRTTAHRERVFLQRSVSGTRIPRVDGSGRVDGKHSIGTKPLIKHRSGSAGDPSLTMPDKTNTIVGTRRLENSRVSAAVIIPKTSIYVGKLSLDTTADDLTEYLMSHFSDQNFVVEKLQVKSNQYSSYRVEMGAELLQTVLDPTLWPESVIVKRFRFFRGKHHSD